MKDIDQIEESARDLLKNEFRIEKSRQVEF